MNLSQMQTALNWWSNVNVPHLEKVLKARAEYKPQNKIKRILSIKTLRP